MTPSDSTPVTGMPIVSAAGSPLPSSNDAPLAVVPEIPKLAQRSAPIPPLLPAPGSASLLCGIAGMMLCLIPGLGFVLGILSIVLAGHARSVVRAAPSRYIPSGLATGGLVTGIIATVLSTLVLLAFLSLIFLMMIAAHAVGSITGASHVPIIHGPTL